MREYNRAHIFYADKSDSSTVEHPKNPVIFSRKKEMVV